MTARASARSLLLEDQKNKQPETRPRRQIGGPVLVCNLYTLPYSTIHGRMAEWSKALVLGTSHFGGAGSNPVPVIIRLGMMKETISIQLS